ncbi:glycosyltransferase family 4 protein [Candidatus Woesearchaeota archaeon]|nr:glycosyltransferase family 4 protein [Candidatus Woesearchaeota archaeon]
MKLGIDCEILKNRNTGVENYTKELIRSVRDLNPILIYDEKYKESFKPYKNYSKYKIPSRLKFPGSRTLYNLISPPKLPDIDIIHLPTVHSPFFSKPKKFKIALTVHDLTPLVRPEWHNVQRNLFFRIFLGHLFRIADHIICVSNTTLYDLIHYFPYTKNKSQVVHSGVSDQFRKQKQDQEILAKYKIFNPYILYVGTLEPRKNLIRTIKAYQRSGIKEKLVIVGPRGWKDNPIIKEIKAMGNKVILTGFVDQSDLPQLYSSAKLFIYPSLYEGFGFPVIEAMKCGTPVITSDISSTKEIAQGAALLVDPYKTDSISRAMKKLISDENLQKELSKKGLDHSKKYNWTDYGNKMEKIYKDLLK